MSLSPGAQARLDQIRAEIDELVGLVAAHDCGRRADMLMQTLILLWQERAAHAKTRDNFEIYIDSHAEAAEASGGEPS